MQKLLKIDSLVDPEKLQKFQKTVFVSFAERHYDGWSSVEVRENNVWYAYDMCKVMYSRGNISEKLRVTGFEIQQGEVVVDMFAGIGYWTLPLMKYKVTQRKSEEERTGQSDEACKKPKRFQRRDLMTPLISKVYACEWNPASLEGLKRGFQLNFRKKKQGPVHNMIVHQGDALQGEGPSPDLQSPEPALSFPVFPVLACPESSVGLEDGRHVSEGLSSHQLRCTFEDVALAVGQGRDQDKAYGEDTSDERDTDQTDYEAPTTPGTNLHILPGDCASEQTLRFTYNSADRVILGLLPSTRKFWGTAVEVLNFDKLSGLRQDIAGTKQHDVAGNVPKEEVVTYWLHIHENVPKEEFEKFARECEFDIREKLTARLARENMLETIEGFTLAVKTEHIERVKWYAPKVAHLVLDVAIRVMPKQP